MRFLHCLSGYLIKLFINLALKASLSCDLYTMKGSRQLPKLTGRLLQTFPLHSALPISKSTYSYNSFSVRYGAQKKFLDESTSCIVASEGNGSDTSKRKKEKKRSSRRLRGHFRQRSEDLNNNDPNARLPESAASSSSTLTRGRRSSATAQGMLLCPVGCLAYTLVSQLQCPSLCSAYCPIVC